MKENFARHLSKEQKTFSRETQALLDYGTKNEINGVATLLCKVLPSFRPHIKFRDVGCYVTLEDEKVFFISSPDGEGVAENRLEMTFEIKCPSKAKPYMSPVFLEVPARYVTQVLAQMNSAPTPVKECIILSWTPESSTAFLIQNDQDLWHNILFLGASPDGIVM